MPHDKNKSPVGWYLGSYLLRFVRVHDSQREDPEQRFLSWENTVLVQAKTIEGAYTKVERIGRQNNRPFKAGPQGVSAEWEYLGVTEVLPIYEELTDGAEIAWAERAPRKLKNPLERVVHKAAIRQ